MILSDRAIKKAIKDKSIIITPDVSDSQFNSSSLDLRVGEDFHTWKKPPAGSDFRIRVDKINLAEFHQFTNPLLPNSDGIVEIKPEAFVLVRTYEHITLPLESKLAARVEGRSKQARLGMTAHITAPTIHAGFAGRIVLEIVNFGPFTLQVVPNESMLCQLIFESVSTIPGRGGSRAFSDQQTVLGTPPRRPK